MCLTRIGSHYILVINNKCSDEFYHKGPLYPQRPIQYMLSVCTYQS